MQDDENEQMTQWFKKHQNDIKDHFKLTASDLTYGLTVNPFLFFLFAFSTHILDAFPLGKKLEFDPLRHFLQQLAEKVGGNFAEDSLLTLSKKYYDYIREAKDTTIFQMLDFLGEPQTVSAFLELINPFS